MPAEKKDLVLDRIHAIGIPLLLYTIIVIAGDEFFARGITVWGDTAATGSSGVPAGRYLVIAWAAIYLLPGVSLFFFLYKAESMPFLWLVLSLYFLHGIMHCGWTNAFFFRNSSELAILSSVLSGATVIVIMLFTWSSSRISSLLLAPYLIWASLVTYFSYAVYTSGT
jgi:tryptophan-rich sensory protein